MLLGHGAVVVANIGADRVLVLAGHPPQVADAGDGGPDGLGRGRFHAGAVENGGQDLPGGPGYLGWMRRTGIGREQEAAALAPGLLDQFLNSIYRSLKNQRDGRELAAQMDAAEAIRTDEKTSSPSSPCPSAFSATSAPRTPSVSSSTRLYA